MILENSGFINEDSRAHLETLLHFFVFPWEEVCEERSLDHDFSPQVPLHSNPASHPRLSDAMECLTVDNSLYLPRGPLTN